MIDIENAKNEFNEYVKKFNPEDGRIKLKIEKRLLINLFSFYNFCTCVCNAYFFGINI